MQGREEKEHVDYEDEMMSLQMDFNDSCKEENIKTKLTILRKISTLYIYSLIIIVLLLVRFISLFLLLGYNISSMAS